jgi:hypothetical protein
LLGSEGLRDIASNVGLNLDVDFRHNSMLDGNQAQYFTALYDFLLREHAINIARPILQLLLIQFPESEQLEQILTSIVDVIEPSPFSYMLYDDDYKLDDSI